MGLCCRIYGRTRADVKFSGKGHKNHVCKDCSGKSGRKVKMVTIMDTVAYHSSKGGVINFTRAVAAELAKYNITCNAISLGYFETELTADTLKTESFTNFMKASVPLGRYGAEGELNPAVIFLASDEASYVTGQIIKVDGGYTAVKQQLIPSDYTLPVHCILYTQ